MHARNLAERYDLPPLDWAPIAVRLDEGWPAEPDGTGTALTAEFSAPSAGPPPWRVYEVTVRSAVALQTEEPGGATRWRV